MAVSYGEQSLVTTGATKFNDARMTLNSKLNNAYYKARDIHVYVTTVTQQWNNCHTTMEQLSHNNGTIVTL